MRPHGRGSQRKFGRYSVHKLHSAGLELQILSSEGVWAIQSPNMCTVNIHLMVLFCESFWIAVNIDVIHVYTSYLLCSILFKPTPGYLQRYGLPLHHSHKISRSSQVFQLCRRQPMDPQDYWWVVMINECVCRNSSVGRALD